MGHVQMADNNVDFTECNVIFVGRTGVGKSSLINRIVGKEKADVGVGHPVTKRKKWYRYKSQVSYLNFNLYDTWGLEVNGKVDEWKDYIQKIIGDRKQGRSGEEKFDYAIYCIAAGGHRIQDFDLQQLKMFKDEGIQPVVVLTKCDLALDSDIAKLTAVFPDDITVVKTSSGGKTRSGKTEPFGWQMLLPRLFVGRLTTLMQKWIPEIVGKDRGAEHVDGLQVTLRGIDSLLRGSVQKNLVLRRAKKKK